MDAIRIGAPYRFVPSAFTGEKFGKMPGGKESSRSVNGRITYINWEHRFFRVTYEANGYIMHECIKF